MGNSFSRDRCQLEEPQVEEIEEAFVIKHQGFRQNQEDDYDSLPKIISDTPFLFYCVLDGHGGRDSVDHCKKKLLVNISDSVGLNSSLNVFDQTALEHSIQQAFITTENQLRDLFKPAPTSPIVLTEIEEKSAIQSSLLDSPKEVLKSSTFSASAPPFISQATPPPPPQEVFAVPPPLALRVPQQYWSSDDGSGCCAIACIKTPTLVCIGSAGDCRAILIKKDWTFELLFEDHKPTLQSEKQRIKDAGLLIHNDRVIGELAVSRSIGDFKYKGDPSEHFLQAVTCVPTTRTLPRQESDLMLLLMSDGIVDGITMDELVKTFQEGTDFPTQLKEVVNKCLAPGKSLDNMTLLAIPL